MAGRRRGRRCRVHDLPSSFKPAEVDLEDGIPDLGARRRLLPGNRALTEATRTLSTAELGDEKRACSRHLRQVVDGLTTVCVGFGCAVVRTPRPDRLWILPRAGFRPLDVGTARHRQDRAQKIPGDASTTPLPAAPVSEMLRRAPVHDDGLDVDRLRATLVPKRSGAIDTGSTQCPDRRPAAKSFVRRDLVAWADEVDGLDPRGRRRRRYFDTTVSRSAHCRASTSTRGHRSGIASARPLAPATWSAARSRLHRTVAGIVEEEEAGAVVVPSGLDQAGARAAHGDGPFQSPLAGVCGRSDTGTVCTSLQPRSNTPSGRDRLAGAGNWLRCAAGVSETGHD